MKTALAVLLLLCVPSVAKAKPRYVPTAACSTYFTVVTRAAVNNVDQGLSVKNVQWFQKKLAKKYPGVCYAKPAAAVPTAFYITVTPDTYHGTRIVNNTSTESSPVSADLTDQNGNTSLVSGTVQTTTTSSTAVPYSFEYGIFTLSVERSRGDGKFDVLRTFQQRGIYNTLYGIPLGGRGHHPTHAVIEDAVKWIDSGGLAEESQAPMQTEQIAPDKLPLGATPDFAPYTPPKEDAGTSPTRDTGTTELADWKALQAKGQAGDASAQFSLGYMYDQGHGVPQDYSLAAAWYRKAAEQGNPLAQNNLGILYYNGHGVPLDYAEAYFWLDIALSRIPDGDNHEDYYRFRDAAASHLSPTELSQAQQRARSGLSRIRSHEDARNELQYWRTSEV